MGVKNFFVKKAPVWSKFSNVLKGRDLELLIFLFAHPVLLQTDTSIRLGPSKLSP